MIYLSAKDNLKFMQEFGKAYEHLRRIENSAESALRGRKGNALTAKSWSERVREEALDADKIYAELRTKYTKMVLRAIELTNAQKVAHGRVIQSAPIEGLRAFTGSIYEAVLDPPHHSLILTPTFEIL